MAGLAASKARNEVPKYGDPLESGNKARYRFWHAHKAQMPLLFEAAWALLCIPASATNNERVHSVSGRICDKQRGSLKPSNIERLTLAFVFLPDAVKEKMEEYAACLKIMDANTIDLADLELLLDAEPPPLVRYPATLLMMLDFTSTPH